MTDARWAAGKDIKEPGWYWWDEKGLPIKAVQIEKGFTFSKYAGIGRDVMYVVGYGGLLEDKPGLFLGPISPSTYHQGRVAGLKAEHARSVRIVKREIKRLTASIKDDKRGKNDDAAAIHVYALSICNTLLGKLQRGRGGKG